MNRQNGLSLVELMISITLGLVLMTGVVQMFVSSKDVYLSQKGMSQIQETGRLAMEFIGRDLRMASYYGCRRTTVNTRTGPDNITDELSVNPGPNGLAGLHRDFTEGLRGFNSGGNGAPLPNSVEVDLGLNFNIVPTDVLVIRGASGSLDEPGMPVSKQNTSTQVYGYTPANALVNDCLGGLCNGSIAVITDCEKGKIFRVSAVPSLAANTLTLTHQDWDDPTKPNKVPNMPDHQYSTGLILPVHTTVYFVARPLPPAPQIPSLWQKIDTGVPQELLQGVENMVITYSQSDTPTDYRTANAVANWVLVSSVRVELLVRGLGQNTSSGVQPITFNNNLQNFDDGIIRQVFTSTFSVRTRFQ